MPYERNADLPRPVRDHLPEHAQTIHRETFNSAWRRYALDPGHEELAHRVAWSAVKRKYRKEGHRWVAMTLDHPEA